MTEAAALRIYEPAEWFVVFDRSTRLRWLKLLPGYRHVTAFGYVPGIDAWLVYNVTWSGTRITMIPHDQAGRDALCVVMAAGETIRITPARLRPHPLSRVGFTCVAAVVHLLGLRCVAVTPSRLYRFLLSNGGTLIARRAGHPEANARPGTAGSAGAGAEIAGREPAEADAGRYGVADGALRHDACAGGL